MFNRKQIHTRPPLGKVVLLLARWSSSWQGAVLGAWESLLFPSPLGEGRRAQVPAGIHLHPEGDSCSSSQYFRCRGKRVLPEDRRGGLVGLGSSESRLKRSLPVRRICSSSFLCRFMSERTLSKRASRFWLRAELPREKEGKKHGWETVCTRPAWMLLINYLGSSLNIQTSRPVMEVLRFRVRPQMG